MAGWLQKTVPVQKRLTIGRLCWRSLPVVECVWNVMAHAQKPDFVFHRNGRVHLNRRGRQFNRLLAAEMCASAVVMLGTPCSEVVWEYWLPTPFASFPFTSPPVRHRVPSCFKRTLLVNVCNEDNITALCLLSDDLAKWHRNILCLVHTPVSVSGIRDSRILWNLFANNLSSKHSASRKAVKWQLWTV